MKVEKFIHTGVKPDGTFENEAGAVHVEGLVMMGTGEGCGLSGCHCSDGYWITIGLPRTKEGVVEGIKVRFDNKREFDKFIRNHQIIN